MNHKVLAAVQKHHMLTEGDRVSAGVSGGADSVALLHFLWNCREKLGVEVEALHLNHNLRGEESMRDEAFVRKLCKQWGVPLRVESRPVGELARETGVSLEECARRERYAFFAECMPAKNGRKIATAHTLSDSTETVLLNLARGTGLKGFCGIPPVRGNIIRPLIGCTRLEVEDYCVRHRLRYVTDSSNLGDTYSRNKLRHRVVPVLRELNPALEESVGRTVELLREDADYLENLTTAALTGIICGSGLGCAQLLTLPGPIRRRILIRQLVEREIPYSYERLLMLEELACIGGGRQLTSSWFCSAENGVLTFQKSPEPLQKYFEIHQNLEGLEKGKPFLIRLPFGKRVYLLRTDYEIFEESKKDLPKALKNALDYDRINKIVIIRQRKPGDSLRPQGRGCTKSIKNLFQEARIDPAQRSRTVVLADKDGQPAWVEGFGADERFHVEPGAGKEVLYIQIAEDQG